MVTDGSYTCGEHNITYRVELLCCTPENNVTLCVNSTPIKINKKIFGEAASGERQQVGSVNRLGKIFTSA